MIKLHWNVKDVRGRRFGRLVATKYVTGSRWLCLCDCGNESTVVSQKLHSGETRSCGCLSRDTCIARSQTHCQPRDKAYHAWAHIIQRCTNPKEKSWKNYGGRGIRVCDRWFSFENFLADMGRPSSSVLTIDRINNDGHYEPGNVRWADRKTQGRNKRNCVRITFRGETLILSEWAERIGIDQDTLWMRLRSKSSRRWSVEEALTTPVRRARAGRFVYRPVAAI